MLLFFLRDTFIFLFYFFYLEVSIAFSNGPLHERVPLVIGNQHLCFSKDHSSNFFPLSSLPLPFALLVFRCCRGGKQCKVNSSTFEVSTFIAAFLICTSVHTHVPEISTFLPLYNVLWLLDLPPVLPVIFVLPTRKSYLLFFFSVQLLLFLFFLMTSGGTKKLK